MQFQRKTRASTFSSIGKILIKLSLIILFIIIAVILIDKIDFPKPKKHIEKLLSNETFKVVK